MVVTLVTCLQVLYLESLRIRARELPALQFFKETLEAKLGIETERGSLAFSLVKHIGLAVIGCLAMASWRFRRRTEQAESLAIADLTSAFYTVVGTYIVPQLVYRRSNGHFLLLLVPLFRVVSTGGDASVVGCWNFCNRYSNWATPRPRKSRRGRKNTSKP